MIKYIVILIFYIIMLPDNVVAQDDIVILGNIYNRKESYSDVKLKYISKHSYSLTDNRASEVYVDTSFENVDFHLLKQYIINSGEPLSLVSDVSSDWPIYQVAIYNNDSFQLYFMFYTNEQIVAFYNSIISYLKTLDREIGFITILQEEREKYIE